MLSDASCDARRTGRLMLRMTVVSSAEEEEVREVELRRAFASGVALGCSVT